ncbi:MAG: hypothetical protein JWP94_574 [Mucilaginibacter sp.]|nr:hypothetical protein [Mucilaginibacter sp.]
MANIHRPHKPDLKLTTSCLTGFAFLKTFKSISCFYLQLNLIAMAKNENVSSIDRKGKPSGNGRESEGLNSAFAGVDPETEKQIREEYIEGDTDRPAANAKVKHPNRHLHKGEDIKNYQDREE